MTMSKISYICEQAKCLFAKNKAKKKKKKKEQSVFSREEKGTGKLSNKMSKFY
jgi:hypothetical protein